MCGSKSALKKLGEITRKKHQRVYLGFMNLENLYDGETMASTVLRMYDTDSKV